MTFTVLPQMSEDLRSWSSESIQLTLWMNPYAGC